MGDFWRKIDIHKENGHLLNMTGALSQLAVFFGVIVSKGKERSVYVCEALLL